METKTKSSRMYGFVVLYDMHTDFFPKALDSISDEDAHNRLNTKANHIAWLTGSLVQQRFELAEMFGVQKKSAADELFKEGRGIQDGLTYPSLAAFQKEFDTITPLLREAMINATDEKLDERFEMMPGMIISYFELFSFMIYREASVIGQIALYRRLLGHEAMKYM